MTTKKNVFRKSMVLAAQLAEEAMRDTPLASKLKANGFTPAMMAKEAQELSALHTQMQMAKAAVSEASAALSMRAESFAKKWATYSNFVRAFTQDTALRRKHGVSSPGVRKGPMFKRGPRAAKSSAVTPATSAASATSATSNTTPITH